MTPRTQRTVFWVGVSLFVAGGVVAFGSLRHFARLTNHQRLAILLPLFYGGVLMDVATLTHWSTASSAAKSRARLSIFSAVVLTLGAILWFALAPDAQAE